MELKKISVFNPHRKTISNRITGKTPDAQKNLPQYNGKSLPAHLRKNPLDGYGTRWI